MKHFFRELFQYNFDFNQEVSEILLEKAEIVTLKTTELFGHSLSAHQIWNTRVLKNQEQFLVWQIHEASDYKSIDQSNYQNSLAIIQDYNLEEIVSYQNTKGNIFTNNIRDILFHVINHSTYHRAQIAMELKAKGIQPPLSDWILYKR